MKPVAVRNISKRVFVIRTKNAPRRSNQTSLALFGFAIWATPRISRASDFGARS